MQTETQIQAVRDFVSTRRNASDAIVFSPNEPNPGDPKSSENKNEKQTEPNRAAERGGRPVVSIPPNEPKPRSEMTQIPIFLME
jgi:hypothetical protein